VTEYGGKLPGSANDMEANIPGIGRYTAGAICSIAYNEQVPVVGFGTKILKTQIVLFIGFPSWMAMFIVF